MMLLSKALIYSFLGAMMCCKIAPLRILVKNPKNYFDHLEVIIKQASSVLGKERTSIIICRCWTKARNGLSYYLFCNEIK